MPYDNSMQRTVLSRRLLTWRESQHGSADRLTCPSVVVAWGTLPPFGVATDSGPKWGQSAGRTARSLRYSHSSHSDKRKARQQLGRFQPVTGGPLPCSKSDALPGCATPRRGHPARPEGVAARGGSRWPLQLVHPATVPDEGPQALAIFRLTPRTPRAAYAGPALASMRHSCNLWRIRLTGSQWLEFGVANRSAGAGAEAFYRKA